MRIQHHNRTKRLLARAAFTLMEMIVVVAIIVALAGIGGFFLIGQLQSSKEDIARIKMRNLSAAVESYTIRNGQPPQQLIQLIQPDSKGTPVLKSASDLVDPWGGSFVLDLSGAKNQAAGAIQPDIYCTTPQGKIIGNWPGG